MAYDLRAALTVIRGSADLARGKLEPNHPATVDIARIARSCEDVAALAMELRTLVCAAEAAAELAR